MNIVVTGGSGRAGRWIVRELIDSSDGKTRHDVTVLDRARGSEDGVRYLIGDIENLGSVYGAFAGADAVVHTAAVTIPGGYTEDAVFRLNSVSTYNVHEAAYRLGIKRVVSTSSQSILGIDFRTVDFLPDYLPVDEDHPVRPQDAYGLSKEVGESIARAYARKGLESVVIRPNVIVMPEQLEQWAREGGRKPDRFLLYSYIDVRDLAAAYRLAIEKPIKGGTVLFVVADDTAVAEPLSEVLPRFMPRIRELACGLTETRPAISNARAKAVLGWLPKYSWRTA